MNNKKEYAKQYYQKNKEHYKQYSQEHGKQYYHKKYRADLKYNLNNRMGSAIRQSLKSNKAGKHWESILGYTVNDLIKHLKKTMPEDYTWQDFLNGKLHIDHIIPINAHNFDQVGQIDFLKCWSLENLQLLSAAENLKKRTKLYKPFQPSLKMAI